MWMALRFSPFVPPAPPTHAKDLPIWRVLWMLPRNTLSTLPDYAFDQLIAKRTMIGIEGLLVSDPEGIRHVLATNSANYRRPSAIRRVAIPLVGDGLFLAEGADWRRQRRILAPHFSPAKIGILLPHFQAAGEHLLKSVEGAPKANLAQAFQDAALEAVFRALFSMPESRAKDHLRKLSRDYVEGAGKPNLLDGLATSDDAYPLFNRRRRRFRFAWFSEIEAIIADRRAQPEGQRDLLDLLLGLKESETGETLSLAEIRDQCGTMFFAGSETTARLLFWAAYLLSQDLEEQARLQAEVAAFPADRVSGLNDLQNWPRLRNVLLEALRLYPPVPHILRDAIGPDEIAGEPINANAQIWISPWVLHRHRKFWDRPTAFLPDRFGLMNSPWTQLPGYMPFGAGPRICIGLSFALTEAQIILALLLSRFKITVSDERPVLPIGRVTTEPSHEPLFALEAI
jgi:cytochrome P450